MQVKQKRYMVSKDAGHQARSPPIHPQYLAVAQGDLSMDGPKVAASEAAKRVPPCTRKLNARNKRTQTKVLTGSSSELTSPNPLREQTRTVRLLCLLDTVMCTHAEHLTVSSEETVAMHERVEPRSTTHAKCTNKVANIACQNQDHDPNGQVT
jgi:hypothetical protein